MIRVTISSITPRGVHPQFFGSFARKIEADDYAKTWRKLAAQAGTMIRIDKEKVQ